MSGDPTSRQLRLEAERARMADERLGVTGTPKVGDLVQAQPREVYRPPLFVDRLAPAGEVAELAHLLDELWEVNQEHVGDPILEVEAYYALTGQGDDLSRHPTAWCRRFFERRADPDRINPMDRGDPFIRFERLLKDFNDILGHVSSLAGTVNSIFIAECAAYVEWYLCSKTWGRHVEEEPDGHVFLAFKPSRADIPVLCRGYLYSQRPLLRDLPRFLRKVRGAEGYRDRLDMLRELPHDAL